MQSVTTSTKGDKKTALEKLRQEAREEIQTSLTAARIEVHRLLCELQDVPATEDYADALLAVVIFYGDEGVHTAQLRDIFPDAEKLATARERLVAEQKVISEKDKNSFKLTAKAS